MRTFDPLLVLSLSFVLSCSSAAINAQPEPSRESRSNLQEQYDSAQRFQKSGDLDRAAAAYHSFLANAQGELAAEYAEAGDFVKSASLFKDASALLPDFPALVLGYAKSELLIGNATQAKNLVDAFLKQNSAAPEQRAQAHQILGRALLKMNKDREAKDEMLSAISLAPTFANRYDLAIVCLDLDDQKCAAETFRELEQSFGDSPDIHMRFGLAYGNSDFNPQAIAEFRQVIAEDPHFPGAHYSLAAALLSAGNSGENLPEAEKELKQELAQSPHDFLTYAALGKMDLNRQRYPEAIRYLRQAAVLNPTNPDAFLYLGQVYFEMSRFVEAESALRKAVALTNDPSRNRYQIQKAHFLLGRILVQKHQADAARGEMDLAHALSDKALSHDRSELSGLLNTASDPGVDDSAGSNRRPQPSAAMEIDAAAIKTVDAFKEHLRPAVADSYNNLGAISATQKRYGDAVQYFEAAANWNSKLPGLDLNWGRAAFMASQFSEAVPPLKRYSSQHPEDAGIRSALAISLFRTGQYQSCLDTLKHVTSDAATIPQVEYIYAESLIKTGQPSLGEQRLAALATAHPDIAEVHRGFGEALALQGDKDKGIQELQKAISLNANDADAHYALGKIELEKGDTQAATSDLESAVQLSPREPAFHQALSGAYRVALRPADAERENRLYESLRASQAEPVTPAAQKNSDQERERSPQSAN